jgi:hypothetical protein
VQKNEFIGKKHTWFKNLRKKIYPKIYPKNRALILTWINRNVWWDVHCVGASELAPSSAPCRMNSAWMQNNFSSYSYPISMYVKNRRNFCFVYLECTLWSRICPPQMVRHFEKWNSEDNGQFCNDSPVFRGYLTGYHKKEMKNMYFYGCILCSVMPMEQDVPPNKHPLTMGESITTISFFHRQWFFLNKFLMHEGGEHP